MANGAMMYKLADSAKLGGPSSGPAGLFPGAPLWAISTVYAAKSYVQNGGFIFYTSAGGTSAASGVGPTPQYLTDNSVTWTLVGGATNITASEATQSNPLGWLAEGIDLGPNSYDNADFIYMKMTGSTNIVAGDFVQMNRASKTCTQSPTALASANSPIPIGIAMGSHALATATPTYGWVMIRGVCDGANVTTGGTAGYCCSLGAATGRVLGTGYVSNKTIEGAILLATAANNQGTVELYWPMASGR